MSSANPGLKQRREREVKAICSPNHLHICILQGSRVARGVDFLVMEHLEGETLLGIESQIDRHCSPEQRSG